jgi:hypothetical protein
VLAVGDVVAGRYRVDHVIGKGGMGVVAAATHLQLGQKVAIKVLHDELATDPAFVERFVREARACAMLKTDHVCRATDVGQLPSGAPYLVMELLDGADLARVVAHSALPIATAVDYVLQACVALVEAHAAGIVHRDLKPGNLFLVRRPGSTLIKVLDFGIAKAPGGDLALTRTAAVLGSPRYMSPEQLRSARDVDRRTDIWALGVILYELVSQRVPFPAESITELAVKVAVDPPLPLDIDPAFHAVVWKCLEKPAERRYQTVVELAHALAPFASPASAGALAEIAAFSQPASLAALPAARVDAMAPTAASTNTTLGTAAGAMPPAPPATRSRAWIGVVAGAVVAIAGGIAFVATRHAAAPASADAAQVAALHDALAVDTLAPVDAAVLASAPDAASDPAAQLRAQLRAAYAAHDDERVVRLGEKLAHYGFLPADLDQMYGQSAQNLVDAAAPAITAAIGKGDCDGAKKLFARMETRAGKTDSALRKQLDACAPKSTAGPTDKDISAAFMARDFDKAATLAEQFLARDPNNLGVRKNAAMASCFGKDAARARKHFAKLPDSEEKQHMMEQCEGLGVPVWE